MHKNELICQKCAINYGIEENGSNENITKYKNLISSICYMMKNKKQPLNHHSKLVFKLSIAWPHLEVSFSISSYRIIMKGEIECP